MRFKMENVWHEFDVDRNYSLDKEKVKMMARALIQFDETQFDREW